MLTINTQPALIGARSDLDKTLKPIERGVEQLASAKRVNRAAEDPAALAIVARLAEQLLGNEQAVRNLNDGISLVQTTEGGLDEIGGSIARMRELSVQSANGTLNDADRSALQAELGELQEQVSQAIDSSSFNGLSLVQQDGSVGLQAGNEAGNTVAVNSRDLRGELSDVGVFDVDISTAGGAQAALDVFDQAADLLSGFRSELGAGQNRFESAIRSLEQGNENTAAAKSRLLDTDYARATAELSRDLILRDANIAMQGQANASASMVAGLLRIGGG